MGGSGSCPCSFANVGCKVIHRCWASIIGGVVAVAALLGLGAPRAFEVPAHCRCWERRNNHVAYATCLCALACALSRVQAAADMPCSGARVSA